MKKIRPGQAYVYGKKSLKGLSVIANFRDQGSEGFSLLMMSFFVGSILSMNIATC